MKVYLVLIISLLPLRLFSQSLFNERQSKCETKIFQIEKDSILAFYEPKEALLLDILKKLETRNLKKIKGELLLQIMIDPTGNPCCISLSNQTNVTTKRLNIVSSIDALTGWKPPLMKINNGNTCAIVKLIFTDDKYIAMRLGFTSKSKFIVLATTELKRNTKDN